jgi:predicted small lipoprotein YifL
VSSFWRSALVLGVSLMATACGKKGPLIYPDMLVPSAPAAVTAQQSGSVVKLQFALPDKDRAGRAVQRLAGVKISRRVAEIAQKDVCRSCLTDYRLFQTFYLDHLPANTQRVGSRLILLDDDVRIGNRYSYSVVSFTADGLDGASSPIADVGVTAPLPAPSLKSESFPTEVKLHFSYGPLISGRLLGYNLYRSSVATARSYQPLNREPLKGNEYVDSSLERSVKYHYSARALITLASGVVAESAESQDVEGMLKDDE